MTQEEPLDMVAYGIGVICMMKQLKETYPDVTKPWYVDDEGALGTYDNIELYFNSLRQSVPGRGYYPQPSKIVLIVHPDIIETGKHVCLRHGFKVCTGVCYLGGFIRDDDPKRD